MATPTPLPTHPKSKPLHPSTLALHADSHLTPTPDVAPPLHLSTTYHYPHPPTSPPTYPPHIYSRDTSATPTRAETLLAPLLHAPSITYTTGLSALHALYTYLTPPRVAISDGYHGTHAVLALHRKLTSCKILPLDCPPEELGQGDVIHLETPLNPTGEARPIAHYAAKAHARGAYLVVDSTFGPPGLQDPFVQGADVVMHSGTKYLGGHSDLLWGVLATGREGWAEGLRRERMVLGSVMGGLEAWLGVRSLRTLELRVARQSASAERLVRWLDGLVKEGLKGVGGVVKRVRHASLQEEAWVREQMPGGFGAVFAIVMKGEEGARLLPGHLRLFGHATSLGGVESLVEWRAMSDPSADRRIVRVSVGVEDWNDLRDDLEQGLRAVGEVLGEKGKEGEGKEVENGRVEVNGVVEKGKTGGEEKAVEEKVKAAEAL